MNILSNVFFSMRQLMEERGQSDPDLNARLLFSILFAVNLVGIKGLLELAFGGLPAIPSNIREYYKVYFVISIGLIFIFCPRIVGVDRRKKKGTGSAIFYLVFSIFFAPTALIFFR